MIGKHRNSVLFGCPEKSFPATAPTAWETFVKYVASTLRQDIVLWVMQKPLPNFSPNFLHTMKINICRRVCTKTPNIACRPIFRWHNSKDFPKLLGFIFSGIKREKLFKIGRASCRETVKSS